ncbi:MAG: hypothetical protein GX051_05070 [Clostridiales bacterium]|nr:hypothetical protein [Clostridiales bacterium]
MRNDDSDIKIFGAQEQKPDYSDDFAIVEELTRQRTNGNTAKAKQLGAFLANEILGRRCEATVDFPGAPQGIDCTGEIMLQMQVLMVFSAEFCLERYLPVSVLCATAVNKFYDELYRNAPDFHETVSSGTAFTFYYLDIRQTGDIAAHVGKSFAMLCGDEDDEKLGLLGKELFLRYNNMVKGVIDGYDFVK